MDTDTQTHLNMHAHIHAYIHTHVHTIAYIHAYINTCIHSYTQAQVTKSCSPINLFGTGEIPISSICSDTIC